MNGQKLLRSSLVTALAMSFSFVACGSDGGSSATTTSAAPSTVATTIPLTTPPATVPTTLPSTMPSTTEPVTVPAVTTTLPATTVPPVSLQPAVWPAADVVIATPEQAAFEFVDQVLGVPPVLGDFVAGDSRSGEIEVFSSLEGGAASKAVRSTLLLRQLGPADGWFVIGAADQYVTIESPAAGATVPAAKLTVSGKARGYEATILVTARLAGQRTPLADPVIAMGGSLETPEPYTAELDLSHTRPGDVIVILVRGDTGLETDPGEFSAIPVVIAGGLSTTG